MQNVSDAIKVFEGLSPRKPASITATAESIYSYDTCIATRENIDGTGRVILNVSKYSVTTSRLQNALRAEYPSAILVTDLPRGASATELRANVGQAQYHNDDGEIDSMTDVRQYRSIAE